MAEIIADMARFRHHYVIFFPDVNECQEAGNLMNNCSENAMCMNFPGSYNCSCNPGYEGDPYSNCTGE